MLVPLASVARIEFVKRPHVGGHWPAMQRAALAERLRALGTDITELSDVREACGLPRLSESEPMARALAHHILSGARGKAALAAVRAERASLTDGLATTDRLDVMAARHLLDIRRAPAQLRLSELRALYAQAQIVRIARES